MKPLKFYGGYFSLLFTILFFILLLYIIDKNKKVLLKIFDLDDEIVDDLDLEVNFNQNKLYIKFKKIIKCCSNCGSVNFLSKGFYKTCLIGCPFNGKPTLIVCKLRKYVCKDCHSYFVENNPIVYKNSNLTRTAVITILDELKPYTATYSQVGRRFGISTTQVINLFDKYVRVKRKQLPRILLIDEFFFSRKTKFKYPAILMNFENNLIIDVLKSRKQEITVDYFFHIPNKEKEAVEFICTDMSYTFKPLKFSI